MGPFIDVLRAALDRALCLGEQDRKWESEEYFGHVISSQNDLEIPEHTKHVKEIADINGLALQQPNRVIASGLDCSTL